MTDNNYFLEITANKKAHKDKPLMLHGKSCVPHNNSGIAVTGSDVLKHFVLVVTRGGNYQANSPFKNVIVFSDNIKITESRCSVFFNFDIFEKIASDGEGEYFVLCSIGTITSNIAKVRVD